MQVSEVFAYTPGTMDHDGLQYALGRTLRQRRIALGKTQKDCASAVGCHVDTISNMERGIVRSSRHFVDLCRFLRLKPEKVMYQADQGTGGSPFPAVGDLTRLLMDQRDMSREDLAERMGVHPDTVDRLLRGDAGPILWGAAAVAFTVPLAVYETAVTDGLGPAKAVLAHGTRRGRHKR